MKMYLTFLIVFTFCLIVVGNVIAQETEASPTTDTFSSGTKFNNAVNSCPIAPVFGIYSINYERLFNQTHGLVARFDYESIPDTYSDASIEAKSMGFILNYRYHLSKAMDSIFLGVYTRYRHFEGTGRSGSTDFEFTIPEWTYGINAGKRWVWDNGFNLTFAFGFGISDFSEDAQPTDASIESALGAFRDEYTFFNAGLGELSVGYAF